MGGGLGDIVGGGGGGGMGTKALWERGGVRHTRGGWFLQGEDRGRRLMCGGGVVKLQSDYQIKKNVSLA